MPTTSNNYSYDNDIYTSDDRPLSELLSYGQALTHEYQTHDNLFQSLLGRTVDQRVFRKRTVESTWEKSSEVERPRVGSKVTSRSMAFTIDEFKHGLGWTRNFVEDNPIDLLREDMDAMIRAADDLMFAETMGVVENGIADGSTLEWMEPPAPAGRSFSANHNHVFVDTNDLFGDANAHTIRQHIGTAGLELSHHRYRPDLAIVSPELANKLLYEDTNGMNYQIREARDLLTTPLANVEFNVNGTRVVQTADIEGDDFYVFDTSRRPVYYNWVRPVEIAQESGAPIVDPSDLITAVGSARFGIAMANPFAGVKVTPDNIA